MDPEILFENEDLVAVNKPAGMIVNKADTTAQVVTLQDWAMKYISIPWSEEYNNPETEFYNRGGIVHRLDKETSGVILIAKNPESFAKLQSQFKERKVKKVYTALAHGKIQPEEGIIAVPVGRLPWNRTRFGVLAGGREAVTKYKVLSIKYHGEGKNKEPLSLVELYPETGRTHQIRVHLKHINHPIFSDFLYAGRKTSRKDREFVNRVFLHASKLSFLNPQTGELITLESPLPKQLQSFLDSLPKAA